MTNRRAIVFGIGAALLLVGVLFIFLVDTDTRDQTTNQTLTVFAAASLTDAFEELGTAFEAQNADVDVQLSFAGSSTLATQINEGAPVDVFASANMAQMNNVITAGNVEGASIIFAQNRLVIIVPSDNPRNIQSLQDLATPGVMLVVAAEGVPVREYTETMLTAATEAYGTDFPAKVRENIISEEANVRLVATKITLGEADAGVVYTSDVTPDIAESVLMIPVPDAYNVIATYPIAVLKNGENSDLARRFVAFVMSPDGQSILAKWNFMPLDSRIAP